MRDEAVNKSMSDILALGEETEEQMWQKVTETDFKSEFKAYLCQSHMEAVISYIRGIQRGQFEANVFDRGEKR